MLQAQIPVLSVLSVVLCSENVSGKQIPLHPSPATTGEAKACVSKLVLYVSCVAGILVHLLPSENLADIKVPKIIFTGLPSLFHAFVIRISFAFFGAFSSLLTQDRPKYAKYEKFCRLYAWAFLVMASTILVCAIFFRCWLYPITLQNDVAIFTSR